MEKLKKIKKSELFVYIFFIIISLCKGVGLSNSSSVFLLAYFFGIIVLIAKIFSDKFSKNEFISIVTIIGIGILDFVIFRETTILFSAIALASMKNIKPDKIIKIMFYTRLIAFVSVILLSTAGIIPNNIRHFYRAASGTFIDRYSFGYTHPNLAHSSFSIIIILWGYLYYNKIDIFKITVCVVLNYIMFIFTQSRTGFFILTLYLILIYVCKKVKYISKIIINNLNVFFILVIIFSFIIAWGYGKYSIFTDLNTILTGRIRYMSNVFNNYSIPLLGRGRYTNIAFDNGFFDLIYCGGLLATIWFFFYQFKTNKLLKNRNRAPECILTIFFIFYSITESYYASVLMNPSLLLFSYCLFRVNNESIKEEENE